MRSVDECTFAIFSGEGILRLNISGKALAFFVRASYFKCNDSWAIDGGLLKNTTNSTSPTKRDAAQLVEDWSVYDGQIKISNLTVALFSKVFSMFIV